MLSVTDINIHNQLDSDIDIDEVKQIVAADLSKLNVSNYLIEINFFDEESIHILNRVHRNVDRATDVLSFPQTNPTKAKLNFLGSIAISQKIVHEKRETIKDAVKHGLLHLLGYDHEDNVELWDEKAKIIDCKL